MITEETNVTSAPAQTAPMAAPAPAGPGGGPKKKKRKANKALKAIITTVVVLAVIAAVAFALWYFLFREKEEVGDILPAVADYGSISSTVEGSGNARAGASSAITLTASGTIEEVLVNVGDQVYEGQPLFTARSPEAEAQVAAAQKAIDDQKALVESLKKNITSAQKVYEDAQKAYDKAQEDLEELQGKVGELTVTAPFTGKLTEVADVKAGQELTADSTLATLVNDSHLLLKLYYSYAYESDIYPGQAASVSVPALMLTLQGRVEEIHKVNYISPEGGIFFEVTIGVDNPGTLTEKMAASAVMKSAGGLDIYPYTNGELAYSASEAIKTTQPGAVETLGNLRDYANVTAGEVLLVQSPELLEEQLQTLRDNVDAAREGIASAQEGIDAANQAVTDGEAKITELEEDLVKAQEGLDNFNAVAPIAGSVTSCTITPGMEVANGTTVITITDTTNMIVEITVDDRNIPFVTPGMMVSLSDWNGMTYMGTVTSIDMSASESGSMGMTNYPVTLSVENYDGSLLQGMWLDYSFVTSQSDNCILVPIQCVKSIVDTEGNPQTVVFLQAEERPDNAIDFERPEDMYGGPQYPSTDEGYWPVPVVTGLSDRYNMEIVSGLNAGDTVFSAYMMTGAYSY